MTTTTNLVTTWYTEDNKDGVDLNWPQTISTTTAPEIPTPRVALGEIVNGNNGSRWMFVQASTTVTANNLVAIDVNFAANDLTVTLASSLKFTIGLAQFKATVANSGDYFWAMLESKGGAQVNVTSTAAAASALFISSTPGVATTSAGSTAVLHGIYANTAITGATTTVDIVCVEPITTSV